MNELFYSAFDLACIINSKDMNIKSAVALINQIWLNDNLYLQSEYRANLKKLYVDVMYWMDYLYNKKQISKELPLVIKDCELFDVDIIKSDFITENSQIDLFFKLKRIEILYLNKQQYSRIKLRTLLKIYGYKRRTPKLLSYIKYCLLFYHIQTYLKDNELCNIENIDLDDMVIIKVL